jgi:hypothetical protein
VNPEQTPAWRRSLDAVLATDWAPEDLEGWLRNLANDSEVSDAEYRDASAEVHSIVYDGPSSALDDPDLWDVGTELDGVDAAVYQLLEGGEPVNEQTLASVGVSYEQYWALVAEQEARREEQWQRGGDAASWSANPPARDGYDLVLDDPTITEQTAPAQDPGRSWSDPVDPARGLLDDEQDVTQARDRVFSALTGLDPADHDTRELTDLVHTDWLEDWTPQEMREHYRRTDYPVNQLGTQHQEAEHIDTQELVDQAVTAAEDLTTGPATGPSDDEDAARAEQLNHWSAEDNAAASDSAAASDEEVSDDR